VAEPVLAAKAPGAPQVRTVDVPKDTTRKLLDEGGKLEIAGKTQMDSKTAPPTTSDVDSTILNNRLANGEASSAQYAKLKESLRMQELGDFYKEGGGRLENYFINSHAFQRH